MISCRDSVELVFPTAWVTVPPTGGNCLDINHIFTAEDRAEKIHSHRSLLGDPCWDQDPGNFCTLWLCQNSY